ncbi:hypothetical protein ACE7GA_18920 [Roseomonas sp. CCTCC AB2023176]|uniref:hypothetical protein n=1 Tax=Roseomonas sp. CCTCC AB2023176 TaxID=3342640 RepID=UPI0035E2F233
MSDDAHPVLSAFEQAILDLLEEFEEGHGLLEDDDAVVLDRAKDLLRQAVVVLREG